MQFKTLALAAVALVAVNAQLPNGGFDNDACTTCTIASFSKDASCAALPPADLEALKGTIFKLNPSTNKFVPDVIGLSAQIQKPDTKKCVCSWAAAPFTASGPAGSCITGTPATCNATQLEMASQGISFLSGSLCKNAVAPGGPSGTGAPAPTTSSPPKSGATSLNIPYVFTLAVLGLAAAVGL
ncbi:hypothetical protein EC968_006281 [Mortierella alpina]|nr:hypothetical protein EC968_006281 [Mortierella alpina]